ARGGPADGAGLFVQRHQGGGGGPGPAVVVAVEDDLVAVKERGGAGAPAGLAAERAEGLLPELFTLQIVAEQARRSEESVDAVAVGGAGGRGPAVPDVAALGRNVPGGGLLPEQLAVAGPDAQDVALGPPVASGGQEDPVAPDDGGGVAGAGEPRLPEEVLGLAPG